MYKAIVNIKRTAVTTTLYFLLASAMMAHIHGYTHTDNTINIRKTTNDNKINVPILYKFIHFNDDGFFTYAF